MALTEADRLEMHLGLRQALGDTVANTVMEHLPPSGWGDVARVRDVDRIENRIDRIEDRIDRLEGRIDRLDTDVKEEFRSIKSSIRVLVASVVAVATGIIVMLVQLNQSISSL